MIRIGTEVVYPDDEYGFMCEGRAERNSRRTGRHLVRVNDKWFDRSDILTGVEWAEVDWV